jgi:hypothetical protein
VRATLKLEAIGFANLFSVKPFCAKVVRFNPATGKLNYEFLKPQIDYSESNSVATRDVFFYYWLESGYAYYVRERLSWKKTRDYFCKVESGILTEIPKSEAIFYV